MYKTTLVYAHNPANFLTSDFGILKFWQRKVWFKCGYPPKFETNSLNEIVIHRFSSNLHACAIYGSSSIPRWNIRVQIWLRRLTEWLRTAGLCFIWVWWLCVQDEPSACLSDVAWRSVLITEYFRKLLSLIQTLYVWIKWNGRLHQIVINYKHAVSNSLEWACSLGTGWDSLHLLGRIWANWVLPGSPLLVMLIWVGVVTGSPDSGELCSSRGIRGSAGDPFLCCCCFSEGCYEAPPRLGSDVQSPLCPCPRGSISCRQRTGAACVYLGGPRALRSYIRTFLYMIRYPTLCAFGIVLLEGSGQQWEFCHSLHCCASGGCSSLSHTPS